MSSLTLISIITSHEFISAISGAFMGGLFVLIGSCMANRLENNRRIKDHKEKIKSVLQAFSAELETLFVRYERTMGKVLDNLRMNEPLNAYYNVTEQYFVVFNANAHILGEIKDKAVRNLIISTYINMKGCVDSFRTNNVLLFRYSELQLLAQTNTDPNIVNMMKSYKTQLSSYGNLLKEQHEELKNTLPDLINKIQILVNSF